jgi:hypothetical protein
VLSEVCARPTRGSHTRTTRGPAQRREGANGKAALQDDGASAARGIIKVGTPIRTPDGHADS